MEDIQIIDLYWRRDEQAIGETDSKYGGFCHKLSMNIHLRAHVTKANIVGSFVI